MQWCIILVRALTMSKGDDICVITLCAAELVDPTCVSSGMKAIPQGLLLCHFLFTSGSHHDHGARHVY